MANILYGVNGEDSGHSTRSKEVIQHLQQQGHRVHVASSDRGLRNLSADFQVTEIYGLRFAYVRNPVRYRKTVIKNLVTVPKVAGSFKTLLRLGEQWKSNWFVRTLSHCPTPWGITGACRSYPSITSMR
jgi:uncharacterized protein (TIGR00661 family)